MSKKKPNRERVTGHCQRALRMIDIQLAMDEPTGGLDSSILQLVREEIERMLEVMDSNRYVPSYGRFVADVPDVDEELLTQILAAGQEYRRYA